MVPGKLVRSLGKISCAAACCGMLRHAAACFYLHMWVPTLLWQIELTCKRRHAQHWWAELITFTIRIVCSGFVDIHRSQMAQSVVAHMQTVLCLDVAHQTERSLNMASRAWSSDKENSKADRHMNAKKWMLWRAAACCGVLQNPHVQLQKKGAAACCGMLRHAAAALAWYRAWSQQKTIRPCALDPTIEHTAIEKALDTAKP